MKTCPTCNKQYADDVAVCPDDGTFLDLETPLAETETLSETAVSRDDEIPHAAETVDRMGTAAAETFERDTEISTAAAATADDRITSANLYQTEDAVDDDYRENPMLGWLLPIIIVVLLIILGYWFCSKPPAATAWETKTYSNKIENKSI